MMNGPLFLFQITPTNQRASYCTWCDPCDLPYTRVIVLGSNLLLCHLLSQHLHGPSGKQLKKARTGYGEEGEDLVNPVCLQIHEVSIERSLGDAKPRTT